MSDENKLFTEHARLYDRFYDYKDYEREAAFVADAFEEYAETDGRDALVLGCGTGRHSPHLRERGFDVTGADKNEEMLAIARERSSATFVRATLPDVGIDGPFDLVVLPFNVVNYLEYDQLAPSLSAVADLLADGGVVVFDNCQLPGDEPSSVTLQTIDGDDGEYARLEQLQPVSDRHVVAKTLVFAREERSDFFVDNWDLARYDDEYVEDLLADLDFAVETYGAYDFEEELDHLTVFVGRKRSSDRQEG